MNTPTALLHVQNMLQVLNSPIIYSEIESLLDDSSELVTLKKKTIPMVEAVLRNAEEMLESPSRTLQISLNELTEAVFEADNSFDEITTLVQCNKQQLKRKRMPRFPLVCTDFIKSCRKIKNILDDIRRGHPEFWSMKMVKSEARKENPRPTGSFVCEKEDVIIGRDTDKRTVLDMLLDTSVEESLSVISIVGIGGLGKTTLAQLVYNHQEIIKANFQLRMWVCVSEYFDVELLLRQILAAATKQTINRSLSMDLLQTKLREKLKGQKFVLVLDDVWNEDPSKWQEVIRLLTQGARDSRVIVTTRSKTVATIVGSHHRTTHELKGLSDEDSWKLFERMALDGPEQVHLEERFIEIGKEIVRKCANVPLAIRVAGSLVKGYSEEIWSEQLKNIDLFASMRHGEKDILNVLKISYHYLPTHLKCCFTYCAVYPKDYKIKKDELVQLWMAQGYILPTKGQSSEVLGEEYFMYLLQRCFFQDVEKYDDEIISCKMHDLIHDLVKDVAGSAIQSSGDPQNSLGDETHHLSFMIDDNCYPPNMKSLRTILRPLTHGRCPELPMMRYLRVLDLHNHHLSELLSQIGELLHLRFLDLSYNKNLSHLPYSITQLHNLQTLKLIACSGLKELPRNLSKLVNLRHINMQGCRNLEYFPRDMNTMTSLHELIMCVVGRQCLLYDIKDLNNLKGLMEIEIHHGCWTSYNATEVREGEFLINKPSLRDVKISWNKECEDVTSAQAWLQWLQPHSNLTRFKLKHYHAASFPNWVESSMNFNICLPNLVKLKLHTCRLLDHLPLMSQLRHLKVLHIEGLDKLEYMESNTGSSSIERDTTLLGGSRREDELVFFPSLETLELSQMPELKGWWKTPSQSDLKQTFPHLSKLKIIACPKLISFSFCPKLERLCLYIFNREIGPIIMREESLMKDGMNNGDNPASTLNNRISQSQAGLLREVRISDVGFLNCYPKDTFQNLSFMKIGWDSKIERLTTGEVGKLFQSGCLSSLRQIDFGYCPKLKSISGRGVWEHFTTLESLTLDKLEELEMEEEEEDVNGIEVYVPWKCLALTLRSLYIESLPQLVRLPKAMKHLTALQILDIKSCENLQELPAWIDCLSSLQSIRISGSKDIISLPYKMRNLKCLTKLYLFGCSSELEERCKEPNGVDWPKIQNIPHVVLDVYCTDDEACTNSEIDSDDNWE